MKYARVLLENCPKEATQLFVDYFTGHYRPKKDVVTEPAAQQPGYGAGAVNAVQYVYNFPTFCIAASCGSLIAAGKSSSQILSQRPHCFQWNILSFCVINTDPIFQEPKRSPPAPIHEHLCRHIATSSRQRRAHYERLSSRRERR